MELFYLTFFQIQLIHHSLELQNFKRKKVILINLKRMILKFMNIQNGNVKNKIKQIKLNQKIQIHLRKTMMTQKPMIPPMKRI